MVMDLSKPLDRKEREILPDEYFEFKSRIHDQLLDLLDLSVLDRVDPSNLKSEFKGIVNKILDEN
jgi:pilus assembly protein CpaF